MWIGFEPHHRIRDTYLAQQFHNAVLQRLAAQPLMNRKTLAQLFFDGVQRV